MRGFEILKICWRKKRFQHLGLYSKPGQTSKMERFAKKLPAFWCNYFRKTLLDLWEASEYVSDIII